MDKDNKPVPNGHAIAPVSGDTEEMKEFHDASIVRVTCSPGEAVIVIEHVHSYGEPAVEDGAEESGTLNLRGVTRFMEDGVAVSAPSIPFEFGSVMELDVSDTHVRIIVQWNAFNPHVQTTAVYDIEASSIEWVPAAVPT